MPLDAIVVLGCRVGPESALRGAAARRVERAAAAFRAGVAPIVITSGGKRWRGVAEGLAFKARLVELGVPEAQVLTELQSWNTRQNARYSSELCRARGFARVGVVTCEWHMPRALAAFRHFGVPGEALPARSPGDTRSQRAGELLRRWVDRVVLRLAGAGRSSALFNVPLLALFLIAFVSACGRSENSSARKPRCRLWR